MITESFVKHVVNVNPPNHEIPEFYADSIHILGGLENLTTIEDKNTAEYVDAVEQIKDQIKISLDKLITGMIKHMKKHDGPMTKKNAEFKKKTAELEKLIADNLGSIDSFSKDDLKDIKVKIGIKAADYTTLLAKIKQLMLMSTNISKDIRVKNTVIASAGVAAIMKAFKDIYIICSSNAARPSGYDIVRTDKFSAMVAKDTTVGELGYTIGQIKKMEKDIKGFKEAFTKETIKKHIETLHSVYADICEDINKLPKIEDPEKHVKQFESLTIQAARVYFYYNALAEVYNYVCEVPFACVSELIKAIGKAEPPAPEVEEEEETVEEEEETVEE